MFVLIVFSLFVVYLSELVDFIQLSCSEALYYVNYTDVNNLLSNNLNKYQIVSVECEGGLNDSGYSIPIKQKVYLKELGKEGTLGIICQNKE